MFYEQEKIAYLLMFNKLYVDFMNKIWYNYNHNRPQCDFIALATL